MNDKRLKKIIASLGLTAGALSAASYLYLRLVKNQSLSDFTVHRFIENQSWKERSEQLVEEDFEEAHYSLLHENRKAVKHPFAALVKNFQEYIISGMQVFVWNDNHDPNQDILLYFHGGGYIWQPFYTQYIALEHIAKQTACKIVMPIYPKAPEHDFKYAFPKLINLYREILKEKNDQASVHLMGDSAGGGLALGFTYALIDQKLAQPQNLILISPWLDLTNSHPDIERANEREKFFGLKGLNTAALYWAGEEANRKHKYVSPKFANPAALSSHVMIFFGTDETFYYDCLDFLTLLDKNNKDYDFEIGQDQYHVYPLYPTVEGFQAREKISNLLNKK